METIDIDQAVFASSDRGAIRGYQLVSKSAGIGRVCGQTLCRWAPTQLPRDTQEQWTLNYFPLSSTSVAVTRTTWGGPEYSGRGGTDVVTLILVLSNEQFASYACDPLAVARTAMAMGLLKLPLDMTSRHLAQARLPRHPLYDPTLAACDDDCETDLKPLLDELVGLILDGRRVAVTGLSDPIGAAEHILLQLPQQARREFSFTTGLAPTAHRPFRAQFFSSCSAARQRILQSQNVVCLSSGRES